MSWGWWCGCGCCNIVIDAFGSDTSANWTDVDGSATIGSGVRSTSSATFLSVHNRAGTTGHGKVTVRGKVSATNQKWGVVAAYEDDDNYAFPELTVNGASSTLKLWKRVGGSDTELASYTFTGAVDTYYEVAVCWDGTFAQASLNGTVRVAGAYDGDGNQAGYRATLSSGTATFDDFAFAKHKTDNSQCEDCGDAPPCGPNVCSTPPIQVTIVIDGVINGTCLQCDKFNATFVFTSFDQDGFTDNFCHDQQAVSGGVCSALGSDINIFFAKRGSNADLEATISEYSGGAPIWHATYTGTYASSVPTDCTAPGEGVLAFLSQTGGLCNGSPATAEWSIP